MWALQWVNLMLYRLHLSNTLKKKKDHRVPSVAQWVKNLTAAAQVAVEARVRSLAWHDGLKDLVFLQLQGQWQLWLRFTSWPGNFHIPWVQPFKKKKKKDREGKKSP